MWSWGSGWRYYWSRLAEGLGIGLAMAAIVVSCTAASISESPAATTAAPSATPSTQPTTAPAASATAASLPSVAAAPAGNWTGIKWISAGPVFPALSSPEATVDTSAGGKSGSSVAPAANSSVFGWSRGYVGFSTLAEFSTGAPVVTAVATSSEDGLHWTASRALDAAGLSDVYITGVVEGPTGLLAVGRFPGVACGGPSTVEALWTSRDGTTWNCVKLSADFLAAAIYTVDAGSAGYIASGMLKSGTAQVVLLSADGNTWRKAPLPTATFGKVIVYGGTSFAAGYVVAGAVQGDEGCGMTLLRPALWWSADGKAWTRATLPGAALAPNAWMNVSRLSDSALAAIATEWDDKTQISSVRAWVTRDGRTWDVAGVPAILLGQQILSNGRRAVVVAPPIDLQGPPTIMNIDDDMAVTTLSQSGNGPVASDTSPYWLSALGPTGIVVLSSDGSNLWLGVPTAS